MKIHRIVLALLLAAMGLQPLPSGAHEDVRFAHPTLSAVQSAFEAGEISEAEALMYKLYAVYNSARLPDRFRSEEPMPLRCATAAVMEVREKLDRMPGWMRTEATQFFARPNLNSYVDTAHFRVHYSTSGGNMIYGWPNTTYRDAVTDACETSWVFFHTTKGWPAPPSDGGAGGGSNLIDCYVDDLGTGYYGVTYSESTVPGGHPNDYTAYFIIDNDYAGFGYADPKLPMRVTVAHEYHHVVQMGLNAVGAAWFMENTATFMEDEIYDSINDNYNYLGLCLGTPWNNLKTVNGGFEYGAFIWPTYLSENWDHSLVRDIWVEFADNTNINNVFDNQLGIYSGNAKNFDTAMAEWATWNVFTGTRDDGQHYIEGAAYNRYVSIDNDINTYPRNAVHPSASKKPMGLGTNYTRFRKQTGSTDNKVTITYQMLASCSYSHLICFCRKINGNPVVEEYDVPVDAAGQASFELTNWDNTEWMFMVVPMKLACGWSGRDFQFDASTTYTVDVADVVRPTRLIRLDQNSPNPFNPETAIRFALGATGPVQIEIFDPAGRHVRDLVDGVLPAGEHELRWGGTDDAGRAVGNGVYFYSMQANGEKFVRKMLRVQ